MTAPKIRNNSLDEDKLIGMNQMCQFLDMAPTTINKYLHTDPTFPKPIVFGKRLQKWSYSEIRSWVESKKRK